MKKKRPGVTLRTLRAIRRAIELPTSAWRSMAGAPRSAKTILLRFPAKGFGAPRIIAAHFAHSDGDGEQPPFGPGWFYPVLGDDGKVAFFAEIHAKPDGWMPLPEGAAE